MDGARGARKIKDPLYFHVQRKRYVVPHELKTRRSQQMSYIPLVSRKEIIHTQHVVPVFNQSIA
jgi:hypothetical protein